jgi:4-amino-4-deoxy-L-arabinose transferase-like glycosyltransferase
VRLVLLWLAGVTCRLALLGRTGPLLNEDTPFYVGLAENLRLHGEFGSIQGVPSIRVPPLYSTWLALFHSRLGVVSFAQILLDAGVAVAVYFLARRVVSARWAAAAGLAYALHPGLAMAAGGIQTEPLFIVLFVGAALALLHGLERGRLGWTALAGVLLGVGILCRSIGMMFPLVLALVALRAGGRRHAALLLALPALVVIPWSVRCTRAAGSLVLVQSASAINWYVPTRWDWNQSDPGDVWGNFTVDHYGSRVLKARTAPELVAADREMREQAGRNLRAAPGKYLRSRAVTLPHLVLTNFAAITGIYAGYGELVARRDLLHLAIKVGMVFWFCVLPFALALVGLRRVRQNVASLLCAAVWLSTLAVHLPMWIEYRFFLPALPFALVTAAAGAQWISASRAERGEVHPRARGEGVAREDQ